MEKMPRQHRDVAFPITQGRNKQRQYIKAVVQILAEPALLYHLPQISVGRRDDANVHGDHLAAAETHDAVFLKHTQKAKLRVLVEFGYFVQKKSALMGQLEYAGLAFAHSSGKRSLLVAE